MYCNKCGKQNNENAKFYKDCGEIIEKNNKKKEKSVISLKKKRSIVVIFLIMFLLICSIGIVLFLLQSNTKSEKNMVKQKVTEFFEGYREKDSSISSLLVGAVEGDNMSFGGISAYFADDLSYKINSCDRENATCFLVDVEVSTINFEQLFISSYEETFKKYGEEGINDNLIAEMEQKIQNGEYEIKNVTCDVIVRNINGEYKIQMNSSLANALTGGMNDYLTSLQGGE